MSVKRSDLDSHQLQNLEAAAAKDYSHLDEHLREEAQFADLQYAAFSDSLDIQPGMFRMYQNPVHRWNIREQQAICLGDVSGKDVLDFGCGMGEESVYLAKLGANVTAFDISEIGVEITNRRARHNNLQDKVKAQIMLASDLDNFPGESFDIIHGLGILHHVDLPSAMRNIHRLLKPGGIAVFLEPMGNSAAVESIKEWIMNHSDKFTDVTDHEENLKLRNMEIYKQQFAEFDMYPYHLLFRIKRVLPQFTWNFVRKFDHAVLKVLPFMAWFAGAVVIRMRK